MEIVAMRVLFQIDTKALVRVVIHQKLDPVCGSRSVRRKDSSRCDFRQKEDSAGESLYRVVEGWGLSDS